MEEKIGIGRVGGRVPAEGGRALRGGGRVRVPFSDMWRANWHCRVNSV